MSTLEDLNKILAKEGLESDSRSAPTDFIDTGIPHLNYILTGDPYKGITGDTITELAGESMSGKTMLYSQLAISTQKAGGIAALWDHENSYDVRLSIEQGLNDKKPYWLFRKGETFEQSVVESNKHARLIRAAGHNVPILHGFDSFAAMIPKSQLEDKDMDEYTMNDQSALARVASNVLKVYKKKCNENRIGAVFINQLAADMEVSGRPRPGPPKVKSKGGKSLPFYADTRLFLKGYEIKKNNVIIGKKMNILVKKNKASIPGDSIEVDFLFDRVRRTGYFDILPSYVEFLRQEKVFDVSGSWISFNGEKFQGTGQLVDHYKALPDGLEQLKKLHKEHIDKGLCVPREITDIGDPDD